MLVTTICLIPMGSISEAMDRSGEDGDYLPPLEINNGQNILESTDKHQEKIPVEVKKSSLESLCNDINEFFNYEIITVYWLEGTRRSCEIDEQDFNKKIPALRSAIKSQAFQNALASRDEDDLNDVLKKAFDNRKFRKYNPGSPKSNPGSSKFNKDWDNLFNSNYDKHCQFARQLTSRILRSLDHLSPHVSPHDKPHDFSTIEYDDENQFPIPPQGSEEESE